MKVPSDPGTVPGKIMVELPYGFSEELYFHVLSVQYKGGPDLTVGRVSELIDSSSHLPRAHQRRWWRDRLMEDWNPDGDSDDFVVTGEIMEWALRHAENEPPFLTPEECIEEYCFR